MNLFKKTNKEYVALDIGTQNTKLLSFSSRGKINRFIMQPTPKGSFDCGVILDPDKLSHFLISCMGQLDIADTMEIVTGLSGKGIITKKIDIPEMDEKLIGEHLPFEVEQYLPYEVDEMDFDYEILKGIETSGPSELPVLIVAVLKTVIDQYNDFFEKSFLDCNVLDTGHFALFNSFEKNYEIDPEENLLLMDVGFKTTNTVAIVKGQVIFTRGVPIGGDFYTKELERKLNLSYEEAEELKKSTSQEEQSPEDIASIIQGDINPMFCDEVFSGYESYLSFFPNNPVHKVYITGGGSLCPNLLEALNEKFNVPVFHLDPFKKIDLNSELRSHRDQLASFGSVVSGLALRMT
ncbi:MAG: type IV pilus assembly protein PilM [Bdellovibrionales bacterium]